MATRRCDILTSVITTNHQSLS